MTPENAAGQPTQGPGLTPENAELLAEYASHLERSPLTGHSSCIDDIVRERSHVSMPCFTVRVPAGQRRLTENLQPVIWRHQRDQTVNITPVDRVNETDYRRDWRKRRSHPPILADDGSQGRTAT
jgi:hypothetical protein